MSYLRIILLPFSAIYSFIIFIRNKLYDRGMLRSHKVGKPVISIGNITTGGTGKTPVTIFAAEYFLQRGKRVGIISRGYKRTTNDTVMVYDGVKILADTESAGDELILITNRLLKEYAGRFFVAADTDRIRAAEIIIKKFDPDLIILDDAFQNRRIKRDLDIVIIDAKDYNENRLQNIFTLPGGNLRESLSNLNRADVIIQNNKSTDHNTILFAVSKNIPIVTIRYKTEYFMDNKNSILKHQNKTAIVFSGLANEGSFIELIGQSGITIGEKVKFVDHHDYSEKDIKFLTDKYSDGKIFITTEKDFVKLNKYSDFINKYPVYYLKIKIEITKNENAMYDKLNRIAG
ncbi:MAG: tetraacyldisaccharide 4'-kinase [bacterium]